MCERTIARAALATYNKSTDKDIRIYRCFVKKHTRDTLEIAGWPFMALSRSHVHTCYSMYYLGTTYLPVTSRYEDCESQGRRSRVRRNARGGFLVSNLGAAGRDRKAIVKFVLVFLFAQVYASFSIDIQETRNVFDWVLHLTIFTPITLYTYTHIYT